MAKRMFLLCSTLLVVAAGVIALATPASALPPKNPCAGVRCMACPDGYVFSPTKYNCCRCVPIN